MSYKVLERNGVEIENIDGAAFNNAVCGGKNYIMQGVLKECYVTAVQNTIGLLPGTMVIQGIRIKIIEPQYYVLNLFPNEETNYQIILQIDVEKNRKVTVTSFLRAYNSKLIQENIFEEESGTYQVEVARFTHRVDGFIYNASLSLPISYAISESVSEYLTIEKNSPAWEKLNINGKEYFGIPFDKKNTSLEMYNMDGERLFYGTYEEGNYTYLYIKDKKTVKIRRLKNPTSASDVAKPQNYIHNIAIKFLVESGENFSEYLEYKKENEEDVVYLSSAEGIATEYVIRFQLLTSKAIRYQSILEFYNEYGNFITFPMNASGYVRYNYQHKTRVKEYALGGVIRDKTTKDYTASVLRNIDFVELISGTMFIDTILSSPQSDIVITGNNDIKFLKTTPLYESKYQYGIKLEDYIDRIDFIDNVVEV